VVVTAGKGRHELTLRLRRVSAPAPWGPATSRLLSFPPLPPSFSKPFPHLRSFVATPVRAYPPHFSRLSFSSSYDRVHSRSAVEREERTLSIHTHGDMGAGSGVVQDMNSVRARQPLTSFTAAGQGRPRTYVRRPWCS
jgi:hypothetical protein